MHANTVRAWSDAGRLRYYRINPRGDRRYRQGDLQRFLAGLDAVEHGVAPTTARSDDAGRIGFDLPAGATRRPRAGSTSTGAARPVAADRR